MTTNTPASRNSWPSTTGSTSPGTSGPETATSASLLAWREVSGLGEAPIPEGFEDIDAAVAQLERDPDRRSALARARQRLGARLRGQAGGLAQLRLLRGLSQKQLAEAIGTSQPHIARIENGRDNVLLATANELARALEVQLDEINEALGYSRRRA